MRIPLYVYVCSVFVASLVALAIVACAHGVDAIDPTAIAPTPGNPCGNIGVVCLDMQGKESGFCCYEGETCGGGKYSVGCPAGACCDIRQLPGAQWYRGDAGVQLDWRVVVRGAQVPHDAGAE